jgi:hypothetical protein
MRMIVLSALLAFGVGLAGSSGASAAGAAAIGDAAKSTSLVTQVLVCRNVKICKVGPAGRRICKVEQVCR